MHLTRHHLRSATATAIALATITITGPAALPSSADAGHPATAAHQHLRATDLIEDCSDDTYTLAISDITLDPAFPEPGRRLDWKLTGTMRETADLDDSVAQVTVKLGVITLIRKTYTLADLFTEWGATLPADHRLPAGPVTLSGSKDLPREIPKGDFRIFLQAYDQNDADLACLKMHVDFRRR